MDERNPIAKVPLYIDEIKKQLRQRDAALVEKLISDTRPNNDKEDAR